MTIWTSLTSQKLKIFGFYALFYKAFEMLAFYTGSKILGKESRAVTRLYRPF
jgi:hypothetical protein